MKPDTRIWLIRKPGARSDSVNEVRVRSRDGDVRPVQVRIDKFFLGSVPSHGIVRDLRDRQPEYTFRSLPPDDFDVLVDTTAGVQRYRVPPPDRQKVMPVCNE